MSPCHLPCLFHPQLEVDLLKAENDRLKVAPGPSSGSTPGQVPGSSALSSPRRSLGLALSHPFSPSLADTGTCSLTSFHLCGSILEPGGNGVEIRKIPLSVNTTVLSSVLFRLGLPSLLCHKASLFGKEHNYRVWSKAGWVLKTN